MMLPAASKTVCRFKIAVLYGVHSTTSCWCDAEFRTATGVPQARQGGLLYVSGAVEEIGVMSSAYYDSKLKTSIFMVDK